MVHVALLFFIVETIEHLDLGQRRQGAGRQDLGLAALEQAGAMDARQHADLGGQRADLVEAAAVDTAVLLEQVFADNFLFELVHRIADKGSPFGVDCGDMFERLRLSGCATLRVADTLVIGQDGLAHAVIGEFLDCSKHVFRQLR